MMSQAELLEKLALFYYFSFLDEATAQAASVKTIRKIKMDFFSKDIRLNEFTATDFVRITNKLMSRSSRGIKPTTLSLSSNFIVLPEKSNWGPWFELRKKSSEKDFRALLYAKILKFSETEISLGLALPVGTIRYRVGRALKQLGSIIRDDRSMIEYG